MKTATLLLVIFTCLAGYSQNLARSFRSQLGSLQFINDKVILSGICNNDQFIASDVRGEGTYSINNDTINFNSKGNYYIPAITLALTKKTSTSLVISPKPIIFA